MFEIKHATSADKALLEGMYLEEVEDHAERARKFAEDLIDRFKTMIALQDNQLCGTLTWDTRGRFDDGVAEIIGLGVNERFKRQGIAKKLVNHFVQETSKFYSEKGYSSGLSYFSWKVQTRWLVYFILIWDSMTLRRYQNSTLKMLV